MVTIADFSNSPTVLVVIPNWNGSHLLAPCLDALRRQTYQDFQIIVVDNGSEDASRAILTASYPDVHVILNDANRGFAAAVNQGIRASVSPFVAVLNNDTVVDADWLLSLVAAAQDSSDVGMYASKMMLVSDPHMIDSAGVCVDRLGFAWDRFGGKLEDSSDTAVAEVFGPSAGAALYLREMLDEIGLFDEDFFAYLEDVDLAWRARNRGWRCLYVPSARVLHCHSATSREGSPFKSYHLGRNKVWLLFKNYPFRSLWYCIPLIILYDLAAIAYALVLRGDIHALRGRIAGLFGGRLMLSKRSRDGRDPSQVIDYLDPIRWPWKIHSNLTYLDRLRL